MLRDGLHEFDGSPAFGGFVCRGAGLQTVVGERQTWRVGERELTVQLAIDQRRYLYVLYLLAGWPPELPHRKSLMLTEVYACTATGTVRIFNPPELSRWKTKALFEAGLVQKPRIVLEALPDSAPAAARETWELIRELLEVRVSLDPATALPMPLSAPWCATWNGTSETTIQSGKRWLQQHRLIEHVADGPPKFGRPLQLWNVTYHREKNG